MMQVIKRDGSTEPFNSDKIYKAIYNCLNSGNHGVGDVMNLASEVVARLGFGESITVESIQDTVVATLSEYNESAAADYEAYRLSRAMRRTGDAFGGSVFTGLQKFQYLSKYARWNDSAGRRETWQETVERAVSYLKELSSGKLGGELYKRIYDGIYNLEVIPSMRLLAMAGKAARVNPISVYNCSYVAIDDFAAFHEILLISMSGCGVGFSVERANVNKLKSVHQYIPTLEKDYQIADSTVGWVNAYKYAIDSFKNGFFDASFDYSKIRPKGSILKTKGGRASGAEPLRELIEFTREKFKSAQGRNLTPLECHDIATCIGSVVVQGGVRRTAMLSLFDIDDTEMLHCKDPQNIVGNEQRWFANNSAVWTERMTYREILSQVKKISSTGTGEPGIFSRRAANWTKPVRRESATFGTNPCGEIALRSKQFCNLSAVVARESDTVESLTKKVELATIIGTIQSMALGFSGLRKDWEDNCREERLLGVDVTGQMDCLAFRNGDTMKRLQEVAHVTNIRYALAMGINPSAAITCTKPSGNSSILLDTSPGIHARHSRYYIRRLRISVHDPLLNVLRMSGYPVSPENGQTEENATTWVVSFPVKSPESSIVKGDMSALEQLEYWLEVKRRFTEHNPSATIGFRDHEVEEVANFLFINQENVGGLSFLPADDSDVDYEQLPYEAITLDEYEEMKANLPEIDYSWLAMYERSDKTTVAQELACVSGLCEI